MTGDRTGLCAGPAPRPAPETVPRRRRGTRRTPRSARHRTRRSNAGTTRCPGARRAGPRAPRARSACSSRRKSRSPVRYWCRALQFGTSPHLLERVHASYVAEEAWSLMRTELVGREQELAALVEHLESALAAHPRVVLCRGEPGIGKTRMAEELT